MSRLFIRVLASTFLFAVLLVVVRGIGAQSKNPLANIFSEITPADGQKQLCWHGICPGVTTVQEARALLNLPPIDASAGANEPDCWSATTDTFLACLSSVDGLITKIEMYPGDSASPGGGPDTKLKLGDFTTFLGNPIKLTSPFCGTSTILFSNTFLLTFPLTPELKPNGDVAWVLDPERPQSVVIAISNGKRLLDDSRMVEWAGFVTHQGFMPCGGD